MKRLGIMTAALMALSVLFFACDTGGDEDSSIKVTSVTISGVGVANSAASIAIDGALTLTATVKPDNATDKNVTWSSSDETKATVTAEGVVTGVAAGEATVTAAANGGGGISDSVTITVTQPVKVESVTIKQNGNAVTEPLALPANGNITLIAEVLPSNTTPADRVITWTTGDPAVATVADGVVTWVGEGQATITATTAGKKADGDPAIGTVTVNAAPPPTVAKLLIFNQTGAPEGTTQAAEVADADFNTNGRLVITNTNTSSGWGTELSAVEKNTFVYLDTPLTAPFSVSARVKITRLIAPAGTDNGIFVGAFTDPTVDNSAASAKDGEPANTEADFIAIAGVNSAASGRRSVYGTRLNNSLINNSAVGATQFTETYDQEYVYTVTQGTVGTYNILVTDDAFAPSRVHSPYTASGINRSGDAQIYPSLGKAAAGDVAEINNPLYLGIIVSGVEAEISNIIIKQGDTVVYSKPAPATPYPPVQSVTITTETGASVEVGKSLQMTASVSPEGAYQGVTWEIDEMDLQYASIDPISGAFTGLDTGPAKVYAISIDNGAGGTPVKSAAFTVDITNPQEEVLSNNRSWNFQQLPVGWAENTNTTNGSGDYDYGQGLTLKSDTRTMKIVTTQNAPDTTETTDTTNWTAGILQQGGVGSVPHFATIKEVQGPFKLTFNYSGTGNSGTDARRIKVKIGETETDPGEEKGSGNTGDPQTWTFTYTGTDKVDVELHGVVNSVRLYDVILTYTGQ